jgi:hypothetical protein
MTLRSAGAGTPVVVLVIALLKLELHLRITFVWFDDQRLGLDLATQEAVISKY